MERRTFEDSLKDAFKDAEATPSEKVWTNVELELEKDKGSDMRRRLVFYQMLAAAAVTIALMATGVAYFMVNDKERTIEQLVARTQQQKDNSETQPATVMPRVQAPLTGEAQSSADLSDKNNSTGDQLAARSAASTHASATRNATASANGARRSGIQQSYNGIVSPRSKVVGTQTSQEDYEVTNPTISIKSEVAGGTSERSLPSFYTASVRQPAFQQTAADPVALMLSKLAEQEMLLASADDNRKGDDKEEKIWTALGVAAGGFSAVNHSTAPAQAKGLGFAAMSNSSVADKQSKASGVAYSMGLSFGTRVANRWVLQGGLNYLTQSSNYVATNVIADQSYTVLQAESINALGKLPAVADAASADRLAPTVPYSVNNNLKYFSVPVQAGYLLVNQKFGVQLNAGISTDLFLENTITPEGGSLDKTTQSSGTDSPYRTVNFSGLMGTEFSYRLGQRYRIALNPALRYPFNSVYKSAVGIESSPLTFDVGLRFRYIFK